MTEDAFTELAPTGVLRAAINMGNPLLVTGRNSAGDPEGVSADMAREIANRLGVDVTYVPFKSPGELADAAGDNVWDIGLIGAEPSRARTIAFSNAYVEIDATYLVPAGSPFTSVDDVDRDGVPDLAIGRLPVRSSAELDALLTKTLTYDQHGYARSAVFAADGFDPRTSFLRASAELAGMLPQDWDVDEANIGRSGIDSARDTLLTGMTDGRALVSYFGHSDATRWSFDDLFTIEDAASLQNAGAPFVATQWGCWNTYYVSPNSVTLAQELVLSDTGAAAVMGATTLTQALSDEELGKRLISRIAEPGRTIGEALQEAKADLAAERPDLSDVILGWTLLGDPALVVER